MECVSAGKWECVNRQCESSLWFEEEINHSICVNCGETGVDIKDDYDYCSSCKYKYE